MSDVLRNTEFATGIWDYHGGISYVDAGDRSTPEALKMPGTSHYPLRQLARMMDRKDFLQIRQSMEDLLASRAAAFSHELRIRMPREGYAWIAIQGRASGPLKISGTWLRIDHRKEREARLADAANRARHFVAAAAHDLRSPLRHIAIYVDLLQESLASTASDSQRELLSELGSRPPHLQKLIQALINFCEADHTVLPVIFSLNDFLQDAARNLPDTNGMISIAPVPVGIMAYGDPTLLEIALANVVKNAIDHCDKDRAFVKIEVTLPPGRVLLRISDNGPGISSADSEKIFHPFWSRSVSRRHRGPGLGLAICKALLDAMDADINLKESSPQGSVFEISLDRIE